MTRLAERVWRLVVKPQSISMMLMGIVIVTPADTTRRVAGYGGVLSLPVLEATDTVSLNARIDQLLDRRDARAERGRVLYAAGHEPTKQATSAGSTTSPRTARVTRSCPPPPSVSSRISPQQPPSPPHQTVVQGRTGSSPNS